VLTAARHDFSIDFLDWEEEMKKILTVLLAGLLVVAFTAPVLAWEFSLKGEYEYRFRYLGRTGNLDLFGIASLQDSPLNALGTAGYVGFAGPTIYNRGQVRALQSDASNPTNGATQQLRITRGGYSMTESDAFFSDSRLTLYPEIRVNPAIRVHGVYNVGGTRNKYFQAYGQDANVFAGAVPANGAPFERYYDSQVSMNAYDTAAIGSWEQFRATIQLPWGIWSIGVKDFPFGVGATLGNNTRAEAFLTVVPYGPFRFLHGIWLSRGRFLESWATIPDSGTKPSFFQGILGTYDAGDLSLGAGAILRMMHVNAANTAGNNGRPGGNGGITNSGAVGGALGGPINGVDDITEIYIAYMKYFNGRFFLNAEYAWVDLSRYRLGVPAGVNQINAAPLYLEAYHWFSEAGVVAGPAKLSLLYALSSGRVLNNRLVNSVAGAPGSQQVKFYSPFAINYQAMAPYQFLMFETFAGGINGGWNPLDVTFVADERGMMTDAYCYAARLDYAVASNLNLWGSYIWAHRLERAGAWKGGILSTGADATQAQRTAWVAANFGAASGEVGGPINPFVDDGFIGWEANLGVDWKLLEGMTAYFRYSYWQPGDWFTQAYQAIGIVPGGQAVSNAALVQGRDAIQAFHGSLLIDF
jgi:hypothetical protein